MKKYLSTLCAGLVVAGAFSGCSDDEFGNDSNTASAGVTVNFTLSSGVSTRTVYDDEDPYQINWTDGDVIRIYCYEAYDVKNADYTVLKDETTENKGTLQNNENGLVWGSGMHNFYAVYPADDSKISVSSDGIATCQLNQNQTCTFPDDATNGNYMGAPDMTNAYMVADTSTIPVDEVALTFKPIMTTLQITLQGRESSSANEEYVAVTGLSIIYNASSAEFKYDIASGEMEEEEVGSNTQTVFVGVKQGDNNYIDLQAGESMTFTVFLPPIDIDSENPITIRPNVAGSSELTVTVNGTSGSTTDANFTASSKGSLTLPTWPSEEVTGNNWITPLDDNIYVQQLSIPGTHDAAAYSSTLDLGRTQGLTLEEQWNSGIRAFDLRPAWRILQNEFWIYHGVTATDISLTDALNLFEEKLEANPGEFVFVQLRHESEGGGWIGKNTNNWSSRLSGVLSGYDIVEWSPNLTIGECRGKMIVLTRDEYSSRLNVGLVSGWPDDPDSAIATITYGDNSTDYHVQDYYSYTGSSSTKISYFTTLMNTTIQFSNAESNYFINKNWAVNHVSGYQGSSGTTLEYIYNARDVALTITNAIANLSNPGPLGIIFMDYAGMRRISGWANFGTFTVNCDLLTQTIIDNNYRYTMQRKSVSE